MPADEQGSAATTAFVAASGIKLIAAPTIVSASVLAAAPVLTAGQLVAIIIQPSAPLTIVSGQPALSLNDGGTATYLGTEPNGEMVFLYTVKAGQNTQALAIAHLVLPQGTLITDAAGNALAAADLSGIAGATSSYAIETTAPVVTAITTGASGSDLSVGSVVTLTLTTSAPVFVTGKPVLTLNDGGIASYAGTTASGALLFHYSVAAGNNVAALSVTGLSMPSGTVIVDAAGNALSTSGLASLAGAKTALRIDTTPPTISAIVASALDVDVGVGGVVSFALTSKDALTVTGKPALTLNDGGTATYVGAAPGGALLFEYKVAAGDNVGALAVTGVQLPSGSSVTDAAGNALSTAALSSLAGAATGFAVDTRSPVIKSIDASASGTGALGVGAKVTFTLATSELVTVNGTPSLTLNDGGTATYVGAAPGGALLFEYKVAAGDNVGALAVTGVQLPSGSSVTDAAGNALSTAALSSLAGAATGFAVDTRSPVIKSIDASASGTGALGVGAKVTFTLATSELVTVNGTPSLTLNDGGTATYVGAAPGGALLFEYKVAAGDNVGALAVTGVQLPSGSSVTDAAGNALSTAALSSLAGAATGFAVDTRSPVIKSIDASASGTGALGVGAKVTFTLATSELVTVKGTPSLTLNDGGTATYVGAAPGGALLFEYKVAAGDNVGALAVTGVQLPSGSSVTDAAGNALSTAALSSLAGAATGFAVDTRSPVIKSIDASASGTGALGVGAKVTFTLATSELVTVKGTPSLTLNDGGKASYAGTDANGLLDFSYTVGATDHAGTLAVTGLSLPAGAGLADEAGNSLNLGGLASVAGATTSIVIAAATTSGGSSGGSSSGGTSSSGSGGTSGTVGGTSAKPWANAGLVSVGAPTVPAGATVLTVGAGKEYTSLSAALTAAQDGDVIEVQAGTYTNDFGTVTSRVSIEGVGGMATFVATVPPPDLKGILTVDDDVYVANLAFTGAAIDAGDGGNGAGIRYEGGQMSLYNDSFTNNQNGVLASPVIQTLHINTVSIDHSFFANNGSGTGYTHNLYIGAVGTLTFTNSITESAVIGHDLKSRALVNVISDNIITDGDAGTASYNIDLPNGGADTVSDNLIVKGPKAQNNALIHFGGEGIPYGGSTLTVTGNDLVDNLGAQAVGVLNQTAISADIHGNMFTSLPASHIVSGPATETSNVDGESVALADSTLTGVLPGDTLVITDSAAHTVTLAGTLMAVEGGAGLLSVYAQDGHVIAIGGSGGMVVVESSSSGGNQITTKAGSTNTLTLNGQDLVDSEGTDTIFAGVGNLTAVVGGTARIYDGTGNNQWTVNGRASITAQGGNPVVQVASGASVFINGTLGYLAVSSNGGDARFDITQGGAEEAMTVSGGGVAVRVYDGQSDVTTSGGTSGSDITFGAGVVNLVSAGVDTIHAGTGSNLIQVSGAAMIYAGSGSLSIYDRGASGATVFGAAGTYLLGGDTGDLTYVGGTLASTVTLNLSSNRLTGGTGHLTIDGGSRETITGGSGGVTFDENGGGANTITTKAGSSNTLTLSGADVVQSWGADTIGGGAGNQVIVAHGAALIDGSTGNSQIVLDGQDTLVGAGNDQVTVNAGAVASVIAGTGEFITETSAVVMLKSGAATGTVSGGSATLNGVSASGIAVTTAGGTATTVRLGDGAVSVTAQGADTIKGGAGTGFVTVTGAGASIEGGTGSLAVNNSDYKAGSVVTIHGGTGALTYTQAADVLVFQGGAGDAVLDGGFGQLDVSAGSGNMTIKGGGLVNFTAGSGSATVNLTPAGGTVTFGSGITDLTLPAYGSVVLNFVAGAGGGADVINGFQAQYDQLKFQGVSVQAVTKAGGSSMLSLSDGTSVTLVGANYAAGASTVASGAG